MAKKILRIHPRGGFFLDGGLHLVNPERPQVILPDNYIAPDNILRAIKNGTLLDVNRNIATPEEKAPETIKVSEPVKTPEAPKAPEAVEPPKDEVKEDAPTEDAPVADAPAEDAPAEDAAVEAKDEDAKEEAKPKKKASSKK